MMEFKGKKVFLDSEIKVTSKDLERWKIEGITGIVSLTHGVDHIDVLAAKKIGISVENMPGINTSSTSEWALFKLLEWARKGREFGIELYGKTVLIIGLGMIGQRIWDITRAMGLMIQTFDTNVDWSDNSRPKELLGILPYTDIVFLCIPYTKENHHFFNFEKFGYMKKGVVLINIGRAGLVDENALTKNVRYIHDENHVAWKTREAYQRKMEAIK